MHSLSSPLHSADPKALRHFAGGKRHPHHTVRVAARDAALFTATLHVDRDGNVLDENNEVTKDPFRNGGGKGDCNFDRSIFEVI